MRVYSAMVRLNGKLENEVEKKALTVPEILMLKRIHGDDAVIKIQENGDWDQHFSKRRIVDGEGHLVDMEFEYDDDAERARLASTYGAALLEETDEGNPMRPIGRLFGEYAPLPQKLPEAEKAPKGKVVAKKAAEPKATKAAEEEIDADAEEEESESDKDDSELRKTKPKAGSIDKELKASKKDNLSKVA